MMNFSKIIVGTAATLLATTSIAFAQNEECLPTSKVAGTQFVKAINADSQEPGVWGLVSNNIDFNDQQWNVLFVAKLTDVNNEDDALKTGQTMFDGVSLNEPQAQRFGGRLFCIYASVDEEYAVISTTPPFDASSALKMKHAFKM